MAHNDVGSGGDLLWRAARIVVPWAALILVVLSVVSAVGRYRSAVGEQESTTATVEATETASVVPEGQPYVRVISDGLNLRAEPSTSAPIVGVLKADQQLIFIEEGTGWYHVREVEGAEGWVAAGGRYSELVQP